jgi:hypothetical protein
MSKTKFTSHKAVVGAIGSTITAVSTAWAAVSLALSDDVVDLNEYGSLATAAVTLVGTVYAIWKVENKVIRNPGGQVSSGSPYTVGD